MLQDPMARYRRIKRQDVARIPSNSRGETTRARFYYLNYSLERVVMRIAISISCKMSTTWPSRGMRVLPETADSASLAAILPLEHSEASADMHSSRP